MVSQVLRKMGSENAHGCAENVENGFGFDFLELKPVRVTGDETWVSFVNVENKEQSK
jgi:hypothetical protein